MLNDKNALNYQKLKYKYGSDNVSEYVSVLSENVFEETALLDFSGQKIVYSPTQVHVVSQTAKTLMQSYVGEKYGANAMEDEIIATLSIEKIDTRRDSVRRILAGCAPNSKDEEKAYGIKRGIDFISDPSNKITVENLRKLYELAINAFLDSREKLPADLIYRNDSVYVMNSVGKDIHTGIFHEKLPAYVSNLVAFIHDDKDGIDQILKSVMIHYDFAYLHPYFDGNGRMARLLQLWYLVQKGYTATLFIPFSAYVNENRSGYYKAFKTMTENYEISNIMDITPFLHFYIENVFSRFEEIQKTETVLSDFKRIVESGAVTKKEEELFYFVLSNYGRSEFSTKMLEKDYRNVAYATVRTFVLKFEDLGLLKSQKYGARVKYSIKG
ncbi:Fic family protein [Methanimicrococcus sp. OttesenSCG-928-J09]|nr:Fic family protein [Methanimicrococcus sp. OttesenSCG-928-J09]